MKLFQIPVKLSRHSCFVTLPVRASSRNEAIDDIFRNLGYKVVKRKASHE